MAIGVRAGVSDAALLSKARTALARGPLDGPDLLAQMLAMPRASVALAERMLRAFLGEHREFARLTNGAWGLVSAPAAATDAASSLALLETPFVVVDIETTGGSARHGHRMTEFAAVPVHRGVVGAPYTTLLNPDRPVLPMVAAMTGITPSMMRSAPRFPEVADAVFSSMRGRVFVAHNATFDWRFTAHEMERANGTRLDGDRLCTVRLSKAVLPQLSRRSLDHVAYYFGIPIRDRHRACGDATATAHVLVRLLQAACDRGWDTWPALQRRMERGTGKRKRHKRSAMPRSVDSIPFND
jgi:DNA polymerase-3 subunit epsilon